MAVLSPLYPSPSDARAKRRGGRGFYRDRGLPYHENRTEQRDQHRTPEEREIAALGRALAELATEYPRFKDALNRVRQHVLVHLRSQEWKRRKVKKHLGKEPIAVEELIEETGLDAHSIVETLNQMRLDQQAEQCTRNGGRVVLRSDGKPTERIYWREAR